MGPNPPEPRGTNDIRLGTCYDERGNPYEEGSVDAESIENEALGVVE